MEVRQSQVEDDEIGRVECCCLQSVSGVLGFKHREAMKFEAGAEKPPYLWFVVNQEHGVAGFIHLLNGFIHLLKPSTRKVSSERRAGRWKPLFPVLAPGSRSR